MTTQKKKNLQHWKKGGRLQCWQKRTLVEQKTIFSYKSPEDHKWNHFAKQIFRRWHYDHFCLEAWEPYHNNGMQQFTVISIDMATMSCCYCLALLVDLNVRLTSGPSSNLWSLPHTLWAIKNHILQKLNKEYVPIDLNGIVCEPTVTHLSISWITKWSRIWFH